MLAMWIDRARNYWVSPALPDIVCSDDGDRYFVWNGSMHPVEADAVLSTTYDDAHLSVSVNGSEKAKVPCSAYWAERAQRALFERRLVRRRRSTYGWVLFPSIAVVVFVSIVIVIRSAATEPEAAKGLSSNQDIVLPSGNAFGRGVASAASVPERLVVEQTPFVESCP